MAKLFCWSLQCDDTHRTTYGLTSHRGSAWGVGKRHVRKLGIHNWTLTVYEVKP